MTALSELSYWFQQPNDWNAANKEAREEDDWTKAFSILPDWDKTKNVEDDWGKVFANVIAWNATNKEAREEDDWTKAFSILPDWDKTKNVEDDWGKVFAGVIGWNGTNKEAREEDDWTKALSLLPDWDAAKEDDEWGKAFAGFRAALAASLNGEDQHKDREEAQTSVNGEQQHEGGDDAHKSTGGVEQEDCYSSLRLPIFHEAFPEDSASPSHQLLNKMLGMSTLSFSMPNLPTEADSPVNSAEVSPAHCAPLKRRRTVSFAELPQIYHVESFKDIRDLWDPAYFAPPPPVQIDNLQIV